jgi:hypothetical protein
MTLTNGRALQDKVEFERSLAVAEVEKLASELTIRTLQCCSALEAKTWTLLNEERFVRGLKVN